MTRDQFCTDFMLRLENKIPIEHLRVVSRELEIFISNFEIEPRETALAPLEVLPYCYKAFIVSKKIEGLSDKSLKNYHSQILRFFEFANKPVENITADDIRVYLYTCQKNDNVTNVTLNNKRVILKSFFSWCTAEGYIKEDPCRKIGKIKTETREREPLSRTELEMIRGACTTLRDRAIIEFLFSTGCRCSEMTNVEISDIDFEKGELKVIGKGNKERTVYLNETAKYHLRLYIEARDDNNPILFVSKNKPHRQLTESSVCYIMNKIEERAGLKRDLFAHLVRHTTATVAVSGGMPITEVQRMLGHNKIETTMIYAKVNDESVKASHRKCIV